MMRLALALVSTALAVLLGWTLLRGWPPWAPPGPGPIDLVDTSERLDRLLERREGLAGGLPGRGPFRLEPIDEETASTLFVMHPADLVYDPEVYYRYRPGIRSRIAWEEHPDGAWMRVTNATGLREDTDADLAGTDLAVLVTGDSHTDGVCNNAESFANLLEADLAAADPDRSVVVLNTGVVGYSFYNYLGALEEALAGGHGKVPDVLVVAVYGGNDFVEALRPHHYFRGTRMPPQRPGYWERIEAAKRVSSAALGQGLNQVAYFMEQPDQLDVALEACEVVLGEVARRCAEHRVRLVVVHVPAAFDVPWPELEPALDRALEVLDLDRSALGLGRELEAALAERMALLGVPYEDLTGRFRASEELCYWTRDLHIGLAGHRAVADAVQDLLRRDPDLGAALPADPPDGPFEELDEEGAVRVRGAHLDGLRSGEWTTFHSGDRPRSRGGYRRGLREGSWTWWYADGQLQKRGEFTAGEPDGVQEEWYPDGTLRRRGAWRAGVPEGPWKEWHPDGSLASEGEYRAGESSGQWRTYHPGGAPESRTTWEDGRLEGPAEMWHPDGSIRARGAYRDGRAEGEWTYHHPGGGVSSRGRFEEGRREGLHLFLDREGRIDEERSGLYRGGQRVRGLEADERP